MVAEITDATFENEVQGSKVPVLVDFWAPWCGPCRASAPHVDRLSNEMGAKMKVVKLNTDENQGVAARFGVTGIPTFLVFRPGDAAKPAASHVGYADFGKLTGLVKPLLGE
ncbi:MAG TPA: thioredoxin [Planctomycetota bacterium]|nr:thioredoxin [Planctomycetota bacterium]